MAALGAIVTDSFLDFTARLQGPSGRLQPLAAPVFELGGTISGTVTVEGSAAFGVRVRLMDRHREVAVAYTEDDGTYTFTSVSPDLAYHVVIDSPDGDTYNSAIYYIPPVV